MLLQMLANGGFVGQYRVATAGEIRGGWENSAVEKRISPLRCSR
jgi:hypothetical protein